MQIRKSIHLAMLALSLAAPGAVASAGTDNVATSAMTEGEVRKVNKETGKVTIKHGPLTNLKMPAMTMVFRVKDAGMLSQVQEGDKIRFVADKVNGAYTVLVIEPVE
jgi:Cu(I)/Ag(I) efflux system periplasmic protein CusF